MFWFNIVTFALMVLSFGLVWLEYHKHGERWMRSYLGYHGAHVVWLFLTTFVYFQAVFIFPLSTPQVTLVGYGRTALSLVIMWTGLTFHLSVARIDGVSRHLFRDTIFGAIVALSAGTILLAMPMLGRAAGIVFNISMALTAWFALARTRATPSGTVRMTVPFLVFSVVSYSAILLANMYVAIGGQFGTFLELNVLITGGFAFAWSIIMLAVVAHRLSPGRGDSEAVPSETMVRDYGLTPREREIVRELHQGAGSREIGERLFISQRTVETHTRNIYRKCGVSGRFELIELAGRYSGRSLRGTSRNSST